MLAGNMAHVLVDMYIVMLTTPNLTTRPRPLEERQTTCNQMLSSYSHLLLMLACAEARLREQPSRMQEQLTELSQQLEVVQHRAAAKEASSRKYKEAVRAFKVTHCLKKWPAL